MSQFPLLTVCAGPELQDVLARMAEARSLGLGRITQYVGSGQTLDLSGLPQGVPCVAFIDMTQDLAAGIATAEYLAQSPSPRIFPVAVSAQADANTVLRAMRAGCAEFVAWPATEAQLDMALENVARRMPVTAPKLATTRKGRLIVFIGTRGGAGATTVAVHAALALTPYFPQTLLIDLHRQLGHVAPYMDLVNPGYGFGDLLVNKHRMDGDLLKSFLVRHPSGLSVLCSPDSYAVLEETIKNQKTKESIPDASAIEEILKAVQQEFDLILIDGDRDLPETYYFAQQAERVFLVSGADVASMRDAARYADLLVRDTERHLQIITRVGSEMLTQAVAADTVALPVCTEMPDLPGPVAEAINSGKPVSSRIAAFYEALNPVVRLIDERAVYAEPRRKPLFSLRRAS